MNILLWALQVALALLCIAGGTFKVFKIEQLQKGVASMRALPRCLRVFLGAFECLAGLCPIVPGATNMPIVLTPIAAGRAVRGIGLNQRLVQFRVHPYSQDHHIGTHIV